MRVGLGVDQPFAAVPGGPGRYAGALGAALPMSAQEAASPPQARGGDGPGRPASAGDDGRVGQSGRAVARAHDVPDDRGEPRAATRTRHH